jgi:hypothetical protein
MITAVEPCFDSTRLFLIANTHILFSTNRGDIKLGQANMLLLALQELNFKYSARYKRIDIIICMDFNTGSAGELYNFLANGKADTIGQRRKDISG